MWKSAIICLSLANLCFLRSWQELHRLRIEAPQELRSGPILALLAGTLLNIVALAALLWVGIALVNRSRSAAMLKVAQCAFLLVLVTPLDLLCRNLYSYSEPWLSGILLKSLWTAIVLLPVTGCVLLTVYENPSALRVARSAVLVVTPLLPLTAASLGWSIYNLPSELHAPRLAEPFPNTPARRLIWLIFDEFDYRIGFQVRPKTVKVPELERLRGESVFATNAYPPTGGETLKVLPTLMTGDLVKKSEWTMGRIEMELASGEKLSLSEAPTVFSRAREAGFNTAIAGWWLPYCTTLAESITACAQPVRADMRATGILENMVNQLKDHLDQHWVVTRLRKQVHWKERHERLRTYLLIREHSLPMMTDPAIGLVMVHWPIPHPLGIYDRHKDDFGFENRNNYLDNFELTDRTLGEIRHALEESGLWERTSLLISSDHPLRPDEWNKHATWTEEESALSEEKQYPLIPFILKLGGQHRPVTYEPAFNTTLSHDLILAVLSGELNDHESVAAWLDARRSRFPIETD